MFIKIGKIKTALRIFINNPSDMSAALFSNFSKSKIARVIPDKIYLKLMYRAYMHKKLDLKNPKDFNEKLQWLKINDRNPKYTQMVDKYAARKYISDIIGDEYLIPLLGVWNRVDDIDFDALPMQFVLKCNHDSGSVIVCKNKNHFNKENAIKKLKNGLSRNMFYWGREWPYKNIDSKIICEKFMQDKTFDVLNVYKILNFNNGEQIAQVI